MIRRAVSRALEEGKFSGPTARALSTLWAACARPERPLGLPSDARVIGVCGATLGGSYVTPTVLALCLELSRRHAPTAVVGHGYRSVVRSVRRVAVSDSPADAGDEAVLLASVLAGQRVPVFIGVPREGAVMEAAHAAPRIIVDALLQTKPRRLARSLLVLDARRPFGAGRCPPSGDLRASVRRLLSLTDDVIWVVDPEEPASSGDGTASSLALPPHVRCWLAESATAGAVDPQGQRLGWEELRRARVGLVLGVGRPERILRALSNKGITPRAVRLFGDHASFAGFRSGARFLRGPRVDLWLTTAKCASKLGRRYAGGPVFVLDHRILLPRELIDHELSHPGFSVSSAQSAPSFAP